MTHKEIEEMVETAIDSQGIVAVLTALVNICHEKAAHIESNWQDRNLAREWTTSAKRIDKAMHTGDWPS